MGGDHNSRRPAHFLNEVQKFFLRTLHGHVGASSEGKDRRPISAPTHPQDVDRGPLPPPTRDDFAYGPIPAPMNDEELREISKERLGHASNDRQDVRSAILALGFTSKQAEAALKRSSTL